MTTAGGILSQDAFISAAPYVPVSRLPPEPGWWQTEILSHHKRADKKHNFPLHCWSLLQLSTAAPACTDGFTEAAARSAAQRLFNHFLFAPDVARSCCGVYFIKPQRVESLTLFFIDSGDVDIQQMSQETFQVKLLKSFSCCQSCCRQPEVNVTHLFITKAKKKKKKRRKRKPCVCVLFILSE